MMSHQPNMDGRHPIEAFCQFISPYRFGLTIDPARVTEDELREAMPRICERLMEEFRSARREQAADEAGEAAA